MSGFMLGEILGRRAGDTWTDETEERFLLPRAASWGVLLDVGVLPFMDCRCGLAPEAAVVGLMKAGDGSEANE